MHSTSVIIPALNEEETIGKVLSDLKSVGLDSILVVDNGSTDRTQQIASENGAVVISEPQKGYGKACLTGIANLPSSAKWVLFCDADGSDDPQDIRLLLEQREQADFIVGNRRATEEGKSNLTPVQNFGNWLSGTLMRLGWSGKGFQDLGPLRLIKRETLEQLQMQDENFGWTVEMQAKILEQKVSYVEVPVNYRPRQGGVSKISGNFSASFSAGRIILSTLGSLWLQKSSVQRLFGILTALFLVIGCAWMGLKGDPASAEKGGHFLIGVLLCLSGFLCSLTVLRWQWSFLFGLAILCRILLLPMPPGDDIWRYLWEGKIQLNGYNPFNVAPNDESLSALRTSWWPLINHPAVTAIYPPLTQLIFRSLAAISCSVLFFKIIFLIADVFTGVLLYRQFGNRAAFYLLNPIVIYSFSGGGHYDSLMILALVASWILFKKNLLLSLFLLGVAVAIKASPLILLPYLGVIFLKEFFQNTNKLDTFKRYSIGLVALLSIPVISYFLFSALVGFPEQLAPAEFSQDARTASLVPWIMEFFNDTVDPIPNQKFALYAMIGISVFSLLSRKISENALAAFALLFAFSPMLHAWYACWMIPFFCERKYRSWGVGLSITIFLYFLLPWRYNSDQGWVIKDVERIILWIPLVGLIFNAALLRLTQLSRIVKGT